LRGHWTGFSLSRGRRDLFFEGFRAVSVDFYVSARALLAFGSPPFRECLGIFLGDLKLTMQHSDRYKRGSRAVFNLVLGQVTTRHGTVAVRVFFCMENGSNSSLFKKRPSVRVKSGLQSAVPPVLLMLGHRTATHGLQKF